MPSCTVPKVATVAPEASFIEPVAETGNPNSSVTFTATTDSIPVTRSPPSGKNRRLTAGVLLLAATAAAAAAGCLAAVCLAAGVVAAVEPAAGAPDLFKMQMI